MPDVYNRIQAGTKAVTLGALSFYNPEWLQEVLSKGRSTARFGSRSRPSRTWTISWPVADLANEEQGHYDSFTNLRARSDIAEQTKTEIRTPVTDYAQEE
jgi:hypothetical protein